MFIVFLVLSWEGGKNHIEEAVKSKKRHWSDDYNDDIDSGKVRFRLKYIINSNRLLFISVG